MDHTQDGWLVRVQGLSELVRDSTAAFFSGLDTIEVLDPAQAVGVADDSHYYRRSRLWLESTLRKTAVPVDGQSLTVADAGRHTELPTGGGPQGPGPGEPAHPDPAG